MGGGSTQIAFLPEAPVYANMFPVRLGGDTYNLYAHSYLFYGQNYIISRINGYLVDQNGGSSQIENPCMLRNGKMFASFRLFLIKISLHNSTFLDCHVIVRYVIVSITETYGFKVFSYVFKSIRNTSYLYTSLSCIHGLLFILHKCQLSYSETCLHVFRRFKFHNLCWNYHRSSGHR